MKSVYLLDENNKLLGKTVINEGEEAPQRAVLVAPPPYNFDHEIPVWDDNEWKVIYTESGKVKAFEEARKKRNQLLQTTDWTQLQDVVLSEDKATKILEYRQKLRDMFNGVTDPKELNWPELPV